MLTDPTQPELPEWLREAYPFPARFLQLENLRMSFADAGPTSASPLLLLHGNPAWSFLFRHVIRRAAGGDTELRKDLAATSFRVIAPDLVGFGLSDKPADPGYHTLERHIEDLSRLVEVLELRNVTLVAHGWGGPIALGYAVAHPANLSRLVLADTFAFPVPNLGRIPRPRAWRIPSIGAIGRWLDSWLKLTVTSSFAHRTRTPLSDWTLEAYKYPFQTPASQIAPRAFSEMFFQPDPATRATLERIEQGLKEISAPVDILWGAHDPVLTRLCAYLLRDRFPHAGEPVFFPDSGHYLPEEAPEAFAAHVLDTTARASAPSVSEDVFRIIS